MILARVFGVFRRHAPEEVPDPSVPWVWSDAKRILHYPECPRARRILRRNRHATGMLADVMRYCSRGCRVCGAKLPQGAMQNAHSQARIEHPPIVRELADTWLSQTRAEAESTRK